MVLDGVREREAAVASLLSHIRRLLGDDPLPAPWQLERAGHLLAALAARADLFPDLQFPAPSRTLQETLYLLGQSPDASHALYLWRPAPGLRTAVHDHSTWAVIAGIEGVEDQTRWRRTDGGDGPGPCSLEPVGRSRVGPGGHIAFGPRDIHSVAVDGPRAIKHLHLYGRSLQHLPTRLDYDVDAGTCWYAPGRPGDPAVRSPVLHRARVYRQAA